MLPPEALEARGPGISKVDPDLLEGPRRGRLVLVSAMTPTPAGEGKTTLSIALTDGLRRRGVAAMAALREPSLGPIFGRKGGAVGGGQARLVPGEQINLHFTGDLHAVTSAHNLLSALADNHRFHQREPLLARSRWPRVIDLADRALRRVRVGQGEQERVDRFDITAASEVMAILCLARDVPDLRARLGRLVVGDGPEGLITAETLGATGPLTALLLDAFRPNLVQTAAGSPVLVHGGPFANIAQGTSSRRATELALRLADVVVTEGGFAFDLGGFKAIDLKLDPIGIRPALIVLVATLRALRYHGHGDFQTPDPAAVERGLANVQAHLDAAERLGLPTPLVVLNRFPDDHPDELRLVERTLAERGARVVSCSSFADGPEGALAFADAVSDRLAADPEDSPGFRRPYPMQGDLPARVLALTGPLLGAREVAFSPAALAEAERLRAEGLDNLPLCLAKTHLSVSDDETVRGRPEPFTLKVTGLVPRAGAGFLTVRCGPTLLMPGMPPAPASGIDVAQDASGRWRVVGIR